MEIICVYHQDEEEAILGRDQTGWNPHPFPTLDPLAGEIAHVFFSFVGAWHFINPFQKVIRSSFIWLLNPALDHDGSFGHRQRDDKGLSESCSQIRPKVLVPLSSAAL